MGQHSEPKQIFWGEEVSSVLELSCVRLPGTNIWLSSPGLAGNFKRITWFGGPVNIPASSRLSGAHFHQLCLRRGDLAHLLRRKLDSASLSGRLLNNRITELRAAPDLIQLMLKERDYKFIKRVHHKFSKCHGRNGWFHHLGGVSV